jgi:surfactin synthase thioesterase subunit
MPHLRILDFGIPEIVRAGSAVACVSAQPAALVRLVCFAHAGGGPMAFRHWAAPLAPDIELWSVTLAGRAARRGEPFAREWTPLVDELATAVDESVASPLALFGHSLGALLAFEVARELSRRGRDLTRLVVSGRAAPDGSQSYAVPETDEELLRHVDALYGGVPDAVRAAPELLDYFVPILRADLELARAYAFEPGAPLRCPITGLTGSDDPAVTWEQVQPWSRQAVAGFDARMFPGGHFYFEREEPAVLEAIRESLLAG